MTPRCALKRLPSLLLAVIPAIATAQGPAPAPNLLTNPGFEAGTNAPTGWGLGMEGKGAGSATWEATGAHSGTRCVRVELQERGDYWMADQMLPAGSASADHTYQIAGWYRAKAPNVAHPTVYSLDANGQFLGAFEFPLPAAEKWTSFSALFRPKAGVDHFRLQLRVQGEPGVVWYDDVKLLDAALLAARQEALAKALDATAAALPGWWCAQLPGDGAVEFRFRDVPEAQVALALLGRSGSVRVEVFRGGPVGLAPSVRSVELTPSPQPANLKVDLLEGVPQGWHGIVTLRVETMRLGDEARLLVGVDPTVVHRDGLVDARVRNPYELPVGEPLPWGARFMGNTGPDLERLAAQNLPKHLRSILGAKGNQAAALALDGLTKRRPDEWRDDLLSGSLKPASSVALLCAGNETEGFQCLFVPAVNDPGTLTAEMTSLKAGGGAAIPSQACRAHLVEYVPFAGRWLPDPLLDQQPFRAPEHGPAVFWVTVSVPDGQQAGTYRGELSMHSASGGGATAEVTVRVPGFSLSRETHLNSSFWLFRAQIRRYYDLPDEPPAEVYGRYVDLVTSHRLSPIDVLEGPCSPLVKVFREADGSLSYEWTRWDAFLRRVIAGGGNTVHVAWTHWTGSLFSDRGPVQATDRATGQTVKLAAPYNSDEHLRMLGGYLKAAAEHVRSLGFQGVVYVQPYDEPPPATYPDVAATLAGIGKYAPGLPRLMDAIYPPSLPAGLRDNVDLWCPLTPGFPGNFDEQRKRGNILWWYVCCGPGRPYANFFTNQSVVENRILFTQDWQYQVTGLLYWGLNYWLSWDAPVPQPRFPEGPWQASTTNEATNYHGDGYFIYPGPTPDHPLSSIRLETLRDGIEDYEYLYLLNERTKGRDVPAEAKQLLAVPPEVSKSLTDYTRDPEVLRKYRESVAEWIERLE